LRKLIEEIKKSEVMTITLKVLGVLDVIKNGSDIVPLIQILLFIFVQKYYTNWNILRDITPIIVKMRLI
jgi:hypothetical protein